MKKKILYSLVVLSLLSSGCGSKEVEQKDKVTVTKGAVSEAITIDKELASFSFKDQFDKEHHLTNKIKKIVFVFSKPTGHIMRVYMGDKKPDYLTSRDILFIADISGMPSLIAKMFAIPDMQESKYPILLIKEKENAIRFRNEKQKMLS